MQLSVLDISLEYIQRLLQGVQFFAKNAVCPQILSVKQSPQCPEELGQNLNLVSLSTSQLLSWFTRAPMAIALVKSGFLSAVLRTGGGTQKSTLL